MDLGKINGYKTYEEAINDNPLIDKAQREELNELLKSHKLDNINLAQLLLEKESILYIASAKIAVASCDTIDWDDYDDIVDFSKYFELDTVVLLTNLHLFFICININKIMTFKLNEIYSIVDYYDDRAKYFKTVNDGYVFFRENASYVNNIFDIIKELLPEFEFDEFNKPFDYALSHEMAVNADFIKRILYPDKYKDTKLSYVDRNVIYELLKCNKELIIKLINDDGTDINRRLDLIYLKISLSAILNHYLKRGRYNMTPPTYTAELSRLIGEFSSDDYLENVKKRIHYWTDKSYGFEEKYRAETEEDIGSDKKIEESGEVIDLTSRNSDDVERSTGASKYEETIISVLSKSSKEQGGNKQASDNALNASILDLILSGKKEKNESDEQSNNSGLKNIFEMLSPFEKIRKNLKKDVIGQDRAVDELVDSFATEFLFDEKYKKGPKGIYLFAGAPGVGKTYLAERCAEELGYNYKLFNMSTYNADEDGKLGLFGMDGAWKNSKDGDLLKFVEDQHGEPCVVILDEFEKANIEVIMSFLQILDRGIIENVYVRGLRGVSDESLKSKGISSAWLAERSDDTSFENVYLFFTTNVGKSLYEGGKQPKPDITKDAIIDAIRKDKDQQTNKPYFPDAILSRFQTGNVILFRHLYSNDLVKIGMNEMERNIELISNSYDIHFEVDPDITALLLLREGGNIDARNFRKICENFLKDQLKNISLSLKDDKLQSNSIHVQVDPNEKAALDNLLYGEKTEQNVILLSEDEDRLNSIKEMCYKSENFAGISLKTTTDYDQALDMLKEDVYDIPLVFIVYPRVSDDSESSDVKNTMMTRQMKGLSNFIEKSVKFNDKIIISVLDYDGSSSETRKTLISKGAASVIRIKNSEETPEIIEKNVTSISLNKMAFDFIRKGKALKFDIIPDVVEDKINVYFRFFEKIINMKSGDDDLMTGEDRMPNVSFNDVIGGDKIKEEAADFIFFLKDPKAYIQKGLSVPKGLLFYGPPGTGKTFMAKAIAHEADVPIFATNGGSIRIGKEGMSGQELLKQYFMTARKYAPSILFIDEIESIALNRQGYDINGDAMVNSLLAEMDGFESFDDNPVVVIGATNAGIDREHAVDGRYLDGAVVRRFTRKFFVDNPKKEDRVTFLRSKTCFNEHELETTVQMSSGLNFGRMGNAIEMAKRLALRENREMTRKDLEDAIETENFGEIKERNEETKIRTAYHEAGHATMGCIYGGPHMPDHATIVSRDDFGGYVSTVQDEKGIERSKVYFENRVRIMLAGRCAEILKYGDVRGLTYGPASDMEGAYRVIMLMIAKLGMDEELGMVYYPLSIDDVSREYENVPEKVQERANQLYKKYFNETMEILKANEALFEAIASGLIENESLNKYDIQKIMEKYKSES